MTIHISKGNSKLGNIANISLPPIITCNPKAKCHKQCYAKKAYRLHPNVRKAWDDNLAEYQADADEYFLKIRRWIKVNKPDFFRWHVSGDIVDDLYFQNMMLLCLLFPDTKFLAFTKKYNLINEALRADQTICSDLPRNLSLIFSAWGNKPSNPFKLPIAYVNDPKNNIIAPKDAIICPGSCEDCKVCFFANQFHKDVCFNIH